MFRFLFRRLLLFPLALLLVHFAAFAYGVIGRWFQTTQNPFFVVTRTPPPVFGDYAAYVSGIFVGDWGMMPGSTVETIAEATLRSGQASLGLLGIVLGIVLVLGLTLGLLAVRTSPPRVSRWLIPLTSVSLSMPSFYIAAVILTGSIYYLLYLAPKGSKLPFPLNGYGWDNHLILPVLVLALRPTLQIAQMAATALTDELHKQYVTASRSFGHTWARLRWRTALKNALPPIVLTMSHAFRWLVVELIIVEWFFRWPGLGSLLAEVLLRPQVASIGNLAFNLPPDYLHPPLLAAGLTCFAALFMLGDLVTAVLVRWLDPRV